MESLTLDFRTIKGRIEDEKFKKALGNVLHNRGIEPDFSCNEGQVEINIPNGWSDEEVSIFAVEILNEVYQTIGYPEN